MATSGSPRARSLAAMLRDVRKRAGISAREVAKQLGTSHTSIGRWETGAAAPDPEDVASFLAVLGVTGPERDRILALARTRDESDWVISGPPGISSQLASVMECERTASRIVEWAPLGIPGLLQTSDYAKAVIGSGSTVPAAEVETRVMVRIARRDALTRLHPVELVALIGEPALRARVGGPEVMAAQLDHLRKQADLPNVTIQAVGVTGDWHPGHLGPFILYDDLDVVYLEHYRSGAWLVDKDDVAAYRSAVEEIRREAMSPDESIGLIADVIPSMETTT